jgi:uncharacterized membrane protein YwaF
MRTALFLLAGLLLLASVLIVAKLFSANYPAATGYATAAFIVVWLVVTAANMWVGVNEAGYTVSEELPILLLLFGVPALVAVVLKWKFV